MTDLRKAAEMALERLESHEYWMDEEAIQALRQALAQPVDAVNMKPDRVDETVKSEHEPVAWVQPNGEIVVRTDYAGKLYYSEQNVYTAPPKKEWVGYTKEDRERIVPMLVQSLINHDEKTMAGLLNAILIDIEQQLKEKNGG